jgi:hypothetical protein
MHSLPELPYALNALAPYMSVGLDRRETRPHGTNRGDPRCRMPTDLG